MIEKIIRLPNQGKGSVVIEKKNYQLYSISDKNIKVGDVCIELEESIFFICKENNEQFDYFITESDTIIHTNQDPHHVYKIIATTDVKLKMNRKFISGISDISILNYINNIEL